MDKQPKDVDISNELEKTPRSRKEREFFGYVEPNADDIHITPKHYNDISTNEYMRHKEVKPEDLSRYQISPDIYQDIRRNNPQIRTISIQSWPQYATDKHVNNENNYCLARSCEAIFESDPLIIDKQLEEFKRINLQLLEESCKFHEEKVCVENPELDTNITLGSPIQPFLKQLLMKLKGILSLKLINALVMVVLSAAAIFMALGNKGRIIDL